jgi:hypothetical protein
VALERWWGVVAVHAILFIIISQTLSLPKLELNGRFLRMSQRREQDIGAGEGY